MMKFNKTLTLAALAASLLMTGTFTADSAMARDIRPMVPIDGGGPGGPGEIEQPGFGAPTLEQVLAKEAQRQLRKLDGYLERRYGNRPWRR